MTAFADIVEPKTLAEAPRMVSADRFFARVARRVIGSALVLAAFGFWFAPGGSWDADIALIKLGLSVFAGFAGLAVLSGERVVASVEVEIDTVRREIRLVRGKGRAREVVSRTAVRDLGQADMDGVMVRLWDADGALLAEVPLNDMSVRRGLMSMLRDEGKL